MSNQFTSKNSKTQIEDISELRSVIADVSQDLFKTLEKSLRKSLENTFIHDGIFIDLILSICLTFIVNNFELIQHKIDQHPLKLMEILHKRLKIHYESH